MDELQIAHEIAEYQGYIAETLNKIQNYDGRFRNFEDDSSILAKWWEEIRGYEKEIRKREAELQK